mgnify:CR=1 FL=1
MPAATPAAWCTKVNPAGAKTAFCTRVDPAEAKAAFCTRVDPVEAKAAWGPTRDTIPALLRSLVSDDADARAALGTGRSYGARVQGLRLSGQLAPETFAAIHQALLKHKVLFFRDQPMTTAQHLALARRFGALGATSWPASRSSGAKIPHWFP